MGCWVCLFGELRLLRVCLYRKPDEIFAGKVFFIWCLKAASTEGETGRLPGRYVFHDRFTSQIHCEISIISSPQSRTECLLGDNWLTDQSKRPFAGNPHSMYVFSQSYLYFIYIAIWTFYVGHAE